jgi:hypothetical protein
MTDPKISISSKTTHSSQPEFFNKDNADVVAADSAVQARAYELYELRGRTDGRAEQDWHQAENDLRARAKRA